VGFTHTHTHTHTHTQHTHTYRAEVDLLLKEWDVSDASGAQLLPVGGPSLFDAADALAKDGWVSLNKLHDMDATDVDTMTLPGATAKVLKQQLSKWKRTNCALPAGAESQDVKADRLKRKEELQAQVGEATYILRVCGMRVRVCMCVSMHVCIMYTHTNIYIYVYICIYIVY